MDASGIERMVADMVTPFLVREGFELVDVEYVEEGGNRYLRVYVDKEGGIDIDECGVISEFLSAELDKKDPIPDAYILEVSSPGAERPLKKPEDFRRAVGKHVYVKTLEPVDGSREFEGTLLAYDEQSVKVKAVRKGRSKEIDISANNIESARLAVLFV